MLSTTITLLFSGLLALVLMPLSPHLIAVGFIPLAILATDSVHHTWYEGMSTGALFAHWLVVGLFVLLALLFLGLMPFKTKGTTAHKVLVRLHRGCSIAAFLAALLFPVITETDIAAPILVALLIVGVVIAIGVTAMVLAGRKRQARRQQSAPTSPAGSPTQSAAQQPARPRHRAAGTAPPVHVGP